MKTRKRRSVDDAKKEILDAAERRMLEAGPGGIRLQEIAADVGISHPAILHHFGSREGLVRAVVDRALVALQEDLVQAFQSSAPDGAALIDRAFETLVDRGHGRFLAWLVLSGYDEALEAKAVRANWHAINDAMHALRTSAGQKADYEDTVFTVMLSALAIVGAAVAGPTIFRMAGVSGGRAAEKRFRAWLARILQEHMER
jgi:AcrR family transcriptional regulator